MELDFSQHIIAMCPWLNLLSLVNETEPTNRFTLTASLSASDAVQVTLSPSTTEIDVMEVTMSTMSVSSMPQVAPTTTAFLSMPTMATGVTQSTEDSLYTLIAVGIGAVLVCFIVITCTVITSCYCQ